MTDAARVLAVAQSSTLGGAEHGLLRVARRLPEHGFEMEISSPGPGPLEEEARRAAITTHRLTVGGLQAGGWPRALGALPRARRIARRGRFQLVWLNGTVAQRLAPGLAGTPLVPHVHDLLERTPLPWRSARFWSGAPVVLCDSAAVAARARELGAPADRLRVVHCPVDPVRPAERPTWADGRPTIGFVGRLEPRKAPLDLLRALPAVADLVPSVRLVLVGTEQLGAPASYAREVRAEAAQQGDRVLSLGAVADASSLMPFFDVLAVPSLVEPFGTVAAEALSAGTPVVATRSGGMEEYVVDGEVGALVEPGAPGALADALVRVLSQSTDLEDACRAAAAPFATGRVAATIAAAFGEALGGTAATERS